MLLVDILVVLRPQHHAVVALDAGEGRGRDGAAVDQVVLQMHGHQGRVLAHTRVTDGIQRHVAKEKHSPFERERERERCVFERERERVFEREGGMSI